MTSYLRFFHWPSVSYFLQLYSLYVWLIYYKLRGWWNQVIDSIFLEFVLKEMRGCLVMDSI
jgi:hypothetical protein